MSDTVVTRFAPSPTGDLHIGGARTALFNWLFARHMGGKYLLRIEDTDRQRSTPEAMAAIFEGLDWLGLMPDEPPVHQFGRAERHREVVNELLAAGRAYKCYASAEELEAMRAEARAAGRAPVYDGRWRDRDPSEAPAGVDPVIRLRSEETGTTIVKDIVQGDVTFDNTQLDDMVLMRSDGTPTYMLAVVVDDHDMGVTHVIRGDDHLNNAGRQMQLLRALGWPIPAYAHVPLIHGPDGAKLSKRHGAVAVGTYRDMGYLPEAMRNYLVRLGWAHGDDEIFSTEQAVAWFTLEAIGRSAARMDFAKLDHVNAHYIRSRDDAELAGLTLDIMARVKGWRIPDGTLHKLEAAMPGLKERAKTLVELAEYAEFLVVQRPLEIDPKAQALLTPEARTILQDLQGNLSQIDNWSLETIEAGVRNYVKAKGLKLGAVAQPLRAALTGSPVSPGIFDVLAVLGRTESLARIGDQAGLS